jgi:hypothetical protein
MTRISFTGLLLLTAIVVFLVALAGFWDVADWGDRSAADRLKFLVVPSAAVALFAVALVSAFVAALRYSQRLRREQPLRDPDEDLRARTGLWVIGLAFVALLIGFVGYILFGYVLRPLMW